MSEQKSFFSTLPGILTALTGLVTAIAGLIYALSETGIIGSRGTEETKPASVEIQTPVTLAPKKPKATAPQPIIAKAPKQQIAVPPKKPTPAKAKASKEQATTDGWTIIGYAKQGKYYDLALMVDGASPAIGQTYKAVKDFRLIQKRQPQRGEQTITLGMVHRGDMVEVLDLYLESPSTRRMPVYAKLRAVLHPIERTSR